MKSKMIARLILALAFLALPVAGTALAGDADTIVLTAEDIEAMQARKMPDVLNHVPGVKAGDSSVGIHGSYKVKVLVDGRSINDPASSHGGVNWDMVSPFEVERVEILRGKGGLVYGQDASGGVILIFTKKSRKVSGSLKSYAGNFDTFCLNAALGAVEGKTAGSVSAGYETTRGYTANNGKDRKQAGMKLEYSPENGNRFGVSADYLEDLRGLAGLPEWPTPFARKESRNSSLAFQADVSGWKGSTCRQEGFALNTDSGSGLDRTLRVTKWSQDIQAPKVHLTSRGGTDLGASFSRDSACGGSFEDRKEYSASFFASQSVSLPEISTTLTGGLRGNYHSEFDDTINPEVKAVFKQPRWRIIFSYGRTENTPSFYQRFNETSSTTPNPALGMEKADNLSLALFAEPCGRFSFSLTGFYNTLRDRITYVTGSRGVGRYENFGEVAYSGADLSFTLKIIEGLSVNGSYTYLNAEDRDTGFMVPAKARQAADITVFCKPLPPLSLVAEVSYSSEVFRDKANTITVPEYVTADIRAEYAFRAWSLFTEIENVADKTYYYSDGLLAPPLTWVAGFNLRM